MSALETEHGEESHTHDGEHESHGGGHKHRSGHGVHDSHGGGGHGGNWIVTYCDMITLLIAFFICILTFASAESGKHAHRKMRDSVIYGTGGTGIAGPDIKSGDQDAVVWRQVLVSANPGHAGSAAPPLYSDPSMEVTAKALGVLEQSGDNALGDSYGVVLPMAVLFSGDDKLTPSGKQLLSSLAGNIRHLPYEVLIEVDKQAQLKRASALALHLENQNEINPARLGIGMAPPGTVASDRVRFSFVKRPKEIPR